MILEIAVHSADSRVGTEALKGLRAAKDPTLRPLFSWLATGRTPMQRRQGVLGLAEIEDPPHLNPLMLSRVADNVEQASILGEALSLDLVRIEEIDQILAIPKLDAFIELALRARLAREGRPIDVPRVTQLMASSGLATRLLGSILLAQSGNPEPLNEASGILLGMADPDRGALVGAILELSRRERMIGASPLLARLERVYTTTQPDLNADLIRTWLLVAPKDAGPVWSERYASAPDLANRIRLALAAIDAAESLEPGRFAPLESAAGEPIIAAFGRVGRALAEKKNVGPAVAHAISFRHQLFENWAAERASDWSEADAKVVYGAILEAAATRSSTLEVVRESGPTAAAALARIDAQAVRDVLQTACKRSDEVLCRAMLSGLLRERVPPVWDAASPPAWPDSTSSTIALVILSRSVDPAAYPAEKVPALNDAAMGVPILLPPAMRAQAAWTLAKVKGEADPLLARLLAGE